MPKFNIGDEVVANREADKYYCITTEGWTGKVTEAGEDEDLEGPSDGYFWVTGGRGLFLVLEAYFDLVSPVNLENE